MDFQLEQEFSHTMQPACTLQGVRDIQFSNDGRKFLSTAYDKVIKLWATETGQVIKTFGEGNMILTAKFHPNYDKHNVLMAGCQDKNVRLSTTYRTV